MLQYRRLSRRPSGKVIQGCLDRTVKWSRRMRKFWMHGARLRSLLVLIVGILIADTSVAESFKKQAIGFGALGSISVPTSWVKSDAKAVLPATRIQFGPPQSKF